MSVLGVKRTFSNTFRVREWIGRGIQYVEHAEGTAINCLTLFASLVLRELSQRDSMRLPVRVRQKPIEITPSTQYSSVLGLPPIAASSPLSSVGQPRAAWADFACPINFTIRDGPPKTPANNERCAPTTCPTILIRGAPSTWMVTSKLGATQQPARSKLGRWPEHVIYGAEVV